MAAQRASSWLDESTDLPAIQERAKQLESFLSAMADGRIESAELQAQERRVTALMKEVEPMLDDRQHAKVTELLAELTAYNLMQMLHTLHEARPRTTFQG